MANIAINGFGRIGRMLLRVCLKNHLNVSLYLQNYSNKNIPKKN